MKRTKFLALALVVAVMMMGAGYAAWTDQLVINNSVSTGHLNVNFPEDGTVEVYESDVAVAEDGLTRTYKEAVVDADDHQVNVTIDNLYPGAVAKVTVPFYNDSTIPVKLDDVDFGTITDATNGKSLAAVVTIENETYVDSAIEIAPGETEELYFEIVVGDGANDVTEDAQVTFTATLDFIQFNK